MRLWVIVLAIFVTAFVISEVSAKKSRRDVDSAKSNLNKHKKVDGNHRFKDQSVGHKKKGKTTKQTSSIKERKRRSTATESSIKEHPWEERDQRKAKETHAIKKEQSLDLKEETVLESAPEKLHGKSKKNKYIDEEKTSVRAQKDKQQKESKPDLEHDVHNSEGGAAFEKDSGSTVSSGRSTQKDGHSKKSKHLEDKETSKDGVTQERYRKSEKKPRDQNKKMSKKSSEIGNVDDCQHSTCTKTLKSRKAEKNTVDSEKLTPKRDDLEEKPVRVKGKKRSPKEGRESLNENVSINEEIISSEEKKMKKSRVNSEGKSEELEELATVGSKLRTKEEKFVKSKENDEISTKKNRKKSSKHSHKLSKAEDTKDGEQEGTEKIREGETDESSEENENCESERRNEEDLLSKSCTAW